MDSKQLSLMNYFKTFESFSQISSDNLSKIVLSVENNARDLHPEEIQKTVLIAKRMAEEHGYDLEKLKDPRVAIELLLKDFSKNSHKMNENLNESVFSSLSNFWEKLKYYTKRLVFSLGAYGGLFGALASVISTGIAGGMADPSPEETPSWFYRMCMEIFPRPENWSMMSWRSVLIIIFLSGAALSSIVGVYSAGKKAEMDLSKYKKF